MLYPEDVLSIALSLHIEDLSREEVDYIIECYEDCQGEDPSATWDLVVEEQIYEVVKSRGTSFYLN